MSAHSHIGASKATRWINCPGSVALEAKMPPQKPSAYAAEGSVAHLIAEDMLIGQWSAKNITDKYGSQTLTMNGFDIKVTQEMLGHVFGYVETVRNRYKQIMREELGITTKEVHWNFMYPEQKFQLNSIDADAFGTCDCLLAIPFTKLIVYDLKYGVSPVDAEENDQLLYYALGAMEVHGDSFSGIELNIYQPRGMDGETLKSWSPSFEKVFKYGQDLKKAISETKKPEAKLSCGEWCKYCQAVAICPEQQKQLIAVAGADFDAIDQRPDVTSMTPERLGEILPKLGLLEEYISSIRSYAKTLAEAGTTIPGHKLVDKWSNRKWIDENAVISQFSAKLGDALFTKKLIGITEFEKLAGKGAATPFCQKEKTGTNLVPDTDNRQETNNKTIDQFDVIN